MIEQLRVPGATLRVDRRGSGPTLLLVGYRAHPDAFADELTELLLPA